MKFENLNFLRTLGALSVCLFHYQFYLSAHGFDDTIFSIFSNFFGIFGPWIFFSISGFIMAYLIDIKYKTFFKRRLLRIYPIYFLTVVFVILLKIFIFQSITQPNLFLAVTLLPFGQLDYPLGIEWTLIYEIFFYIICSFFTFETLRLRKFYLISIIIWGILILSFNESIGLLTTFPKILFSKFNLLFIGGGISYYLNKYLNINNYFWLFIMLVLSCMLLFLRNYIKIDEIYIFSISFIIILYTISKLKIDFAFWNKCCESGDYSYGLYLLHVPIITICLSLIKDQELSNVLAIAIFFIILLGGDLWEKMDICIRKKIKTIINDKVTL